MARWTRLALISLACLLALVAAPVAAQAQDWNEPVPGPLDTAPASAPDYPDIASVGGVAMVGWSELANSFEKTFVRQLTGGAWPFVGGGSAIAGRFAGPYVEVADIGGVPYIAYQAWTGVVPPNQIRVRRFQGGSWQDVGGSLNIDSAREASKPSIASVGGVAYVAWSEEDSVGEGQIYVKRFNGTTWEEPDPGSLNIATAAYGFGAVVAAVGGVPYVAWEEDGASDDGLIYVKRLDGSNWVQPVPGTLTIAPPADSFVPSIADIGGVPHVGWLEDDGPGPTRTYVKRLQGGAWNQVGGGPAEPDPSRDGGGLIANVGGQLWVALNQDNGTNDVGYVRRLDGSGWTTVGSPLNIDPAHNAIGPRLADVGGAPYVVWREGNVGSCEHGYQPSNTCRIYVKRFGTPGGGGGGPAPPDAQRITNFKVSPSAFVAASRGASVVASAKGKPGKGKGRGKRKAKPKTGATVGYRLANAGTVRFTATTKQPGRRVDGKCRKPSKRNRGKRKCTRTVTVPGSFSRVGKAGANSFRFSGRIGGRKLRVGKYTLHATAGSAKAKRDFKIKK